MNQQFDRLTANCQSFVPRGAATPTSNIQSFPPANLTPLAQHHHHQHQKLQSPFHQNTLHPPSQSFGSFSDYSNQIMIKTPMVSRSGQMHGALTPVHQHQQHYCHQKSPIAIMHGNVAFGQGQISQQQQTYAPPVGYQQQIHQQSPQVQHQPQQINRVIYQQQQTKNTYMVQQQQQSAYITMPINQHLVNTNPQLHQHPPVSDDSMKVQQSEMKLMVVACQQPAALPLNKIQYACTQSTSPITNSTAAEDVDDSQYNSDDEDDYSMSGFESPAQKQMKNQQQQQSQGGRTPAAAKNVRGETGWKKKVKTELCRFWLNGHSCDNSGKDQGCGFAHGQDELQKKKGLSRQYLTSVCKNFLDHPSKCTYGQRCIFQHPTFDVRDRQKYTDMMQDNARYTAMRLFQDIEGSEVIYINTYAATAPRLDAFKGICSSNKDNGDDHQDEDAQEIEEKEEDEAVSDLELSMSTFSRDIFHNASQ